MKVFQPVWLQLLSNYKPDKLVDVFSVLFQTRHHMSASPPFTPLNGGVFIEKIQDCSG